MEIVRNWRLQETRYRLIGSNCQACGKKHFPERPVCPDCGAHGTVFNSDSGNNNGQVNLEQFQRQDPKVSG